MKTLLIIAAVTTIVYGFNVQRAENFKNNYDECHEELGYSEFTLHIEMFRCALHKDGQIFNENGEFSKDEFLTFMEDVIADPHDLKETQRLFSDYYKDRSRQSRHMLDIWMESPQTFLMRILAVILLF